MYQHQELTHKIIAAAIEVHKILGPGLLESAYRFCFNVALLKHGIYRCVFNAHEHVVKSGATSRSDNSFNAEGE